MRIETVDQNAQLDNLNPQNSCIDYGELILPAAFTDAMSLEQQIFWLLVHKEDRLKAGENITLTKNQDGTLTISSTGGSSSDTTYRIIEVEPESGYAAAYALQNIDTQEISGETIQIPEGGSGTTPVISATASVDSSIGTPSVNVSKTGTDEAPNFDFAFHNLKGETGRNGENGQNGAPGYSPSANIQQTATGAVVTITDEFGTTQAEIYNGSDGAPGQEGAPGADGVSPVANVQSITGGARITITDANGTTTSDIMDGSDGSDGDDGVGISSIAFKETDASGNNVYTITLTNNNTYDFTANRGPQGLQGPQGIPGSGADGVGISNITFDHEDASGNYVYLVTLSNNQTYTFTAPRGPQGLQGVQGVQGNPGATGSPGADGVSPVANVQSITGGARITITDANGTTTADVMDGAPGQNGQNGAPGYSPTASIQQTANGATITITDENGTTTATITNGQSGSNGVGISGITFKETDANGNNVYTVTLTDSSTYDITCPKGSQGSVGPAGPGVPPGGVDGQVLIKDGSTNYVTRWGNPSSGSTIEELTFGLSADNPDVTMFFGINSLMYGNMISAVNTPNVTFKLQKISDGSHTSFALQPTDNNGTLAETYFTKGNFNLKAGTEINYSGFQSDGYITTQKVVDFFDEFFPAVGEVVYVYLPSLKCQIYFSGNDYGRNYMNCVAYFSAQLSWSNNVKRVRFNTVLRTNLPYDTSQFREAGFFILP